MDPLAMGAEAAAKAVVNDGEVTVKFDVDPFTPEQIRAFIDSVVDGVRNAGREIKGIRAETPTLGALGVIKENQNSGRYRDVIVVETQLADIGSPIEIVIAASA